MKIKQWIPSLLLLGVVCALAVAASHVSNLEAPEDYLDEINTRITELETTKKSLEASVAETEESLNTAVEQLNQLQVIKDDIDKNKEQYTELLNQWRDVSQKSESIITSDKYANVSDPPGPNYDVKALKYIERGSAATGAVAGIFGGLFGGMFANTMDGNLHQGALDVMDAVNAFSSIILDNYIQGQKAAATLTAGSKINEVLYESDATGSHLINEIKLLDEFYSAESQDTDRAKSALHDIAKSIFAIENYSSIYESFLPDSDSSSDYFEYEIEGCTYYLNNILKQYGDNPDISSYLTQDEMKAIYMDVADKHENLAKSLIPAVWSDLTTLDTVLISDRGEGKIKIIKRYSNNLPFAAFDNIGNAYYGYGKDGVPWIFKVNGKYLIFDPNESETMKILYSDFSDSDTMDIRGMCSLLRIKLNAITKQDYEETQTVY